MIEGVPIVESDPVGNWIILEPRPGIMRLVAKSKKYIMSVVPELLTVDEHTERDEHTIEVVFYENNDGEDGEQFSEGGIISQKDMMIENRKPEWWSEFAARYGQHFAQIADTSSPTELFSKTFPDVLEARAKRVAELDSELPID